MKLACVLHARRRACNCAIDAHPHLAVLGVFSSEANRFFRDAIRATWSVPKLRRRAGVVVRLVLRGGNVSNDTARETASHGDMLLLDAPSNMSRTVGPLRTLRLWLHCAFAVWPHARHIGKADDDTWINLPAISEHLQRSASILGGQAALLYWGAMETYRWDRRRHRPIGFQHRFGRREGALPCNALTDSSGRDFATLPVAQRWRSSLVGPFHFAKGALLFVARSLVGQLIASPEVWRDVVAAEQTEQGGGVPWEDVWLGYALAQTANQSARGPGMRSKLAMVSIGALNYAEGWQRSHSSTDALVWHAGPGLRKQLPGAISEQLRKIQEHADTADAASCKRAAHELTCREGTSCAGAAWLKCQATSANWSLVCEAERARTGSET